MGRDYMSGLERKKKHTLINWGNFQEAHMQSEADTVDFIYV